MSNAPHMVLSARNGQKMGNIEMVDAMLGALHDPFENIHMGVTAENVAAANEAIGVTSQSNRLYNFSIPVTIVVAISHRFIEVVTIPQPFGYQLLQPPEPPFP